MACQTCSGATLRCSFGSTLSSLAVLPQNGVFAEKPAANIVDNKPMVNIQPFGMCRSLANPAVAAATAAAWGVLTPQPCMPSIPGPWMPGSPSVFIGKMPAVNNTCKLLCTWAGVIEVVNPGQAIVQIA